MIYVECKPDKALLRTIGINENEIYHTGGKSRVIFKLLRSERCCGVIDEDPTAPNLPNKFRNHFRKKQENFGTKIFEDEKQNKLIMICPKLEEWVVNIVRKYRIDLKSFNLPEDSESLHKTINFTVKDFEKLISQISDKEELIFLKNQVQKK